MNNTQKEAYCEEAKKVIMQQAEKIEKLEELITDFTLCTNEDCPSHEFCWRFNAPPAKEFQPYGEFMLYDGEMKCYYYIEMPEKGDEE